MIRRKKSRKKNHESQMCVMFIFTPCCCCTESWNKALSDKSSQVFDVSKWSLIITIRINSHNPKTCFWHMVCRNCICCRPNKLLHSMKCQQELRGRWKKRPHRNLPKQSKWLYIIRLLKLCLPLKSFIYHCDGQWNKFTSSFACPVYMP